MRGLRRRKDWIGAAVAVGTIVNGLRLRRRLAALKRLDATTVEPSETTGTVESVGSTNVDESVGSDRFVDDVGSPTSVDEFIVVAAPGVDVDPATEAAAVRFARDNGLDAVELVPADVHVRDALALAQFTDLRRYRIDPLTAGVSARHGIVMRRAVAERAAIETPADVVAFARISRRVKLYAPRTFDIAVASNLASSRSTPAERRALLADDPAASFKLGTTVARGGALAAGLAISPVWGLAALAAYCAEPALAVRGSAVQPQDLTVGASLRRWISEPLNWVRIARAGAAPGTDAENEPDPVEARRDRYSELLTDGTAVFFEDRQPSCPLCGSTELTEVLHTRDIYQRKPGEFVLDECMSCGHVFQNPRLSLRGLDFYYGDFYEGLGEAGTEFAFSQAGDSYQGRAALVARHTTPKRWLDVGTGHGHFCLMAKEHFPDTVFDGLDMSESIEEAERRQWVERGFRGLFPDMASGLGGTYDVVSMHHYLEHTLDPLSELDAARAALRPGGHLLIEVPDPDCWFSRVLGSAWTQWVQPQHLHFMSVANLSAALEARAFEVVEVERGPVHLPVDLGGSVILSALRYAPPPTVPWLDPPTPIQRLGRGVTLGAALPLALSLIAVDRAVMAPLANKVDGVSNAYRLLARSRHTGP